MHNRKGETKGSLKKYLNAILEGGFPYAIIVKLQDIKEIKPS